MKNVGETSCIKEAVSHVAATTLSIVVLFLALSLFGCHQGPRLEKNHIPVTLGHTTLSAEGTPVTETADQFASEERSGITEHQIKIGSCCALSGPAAKLGIRLNEGASSYLDYVNDHGGVNGRKIVLTVHDDDYDPSKAVSCFNQMLRENELAGAFFVGSPLAARYVPMAESHTCRFWEFCPVLNYCMNPSDLML